MGSDGGGREWGRVMEGGGERKFTDMESSSPMSIHGCWPLFVGSCLVGSCYFYG